MNSVLYRLVCGFPLVLALLFGTAVVVDCLEIETEQFEEADGSGSSSLEATPPRGLSGRRALVSPGQIYFLPAALLRRPARIFAGPASPVSGHRLANGLNAPLLT